MASISTDSNGNRTIQFVAADGKRRSLRLGKMSLRNVESIKIKVEALNIAAISGNALDAEVAVWLSNRDKVLLDKLAALGLILKREAATLDVFIGNYLEKRTDLKPRTKVNLEQARGNLRAFFGANKPLGAITAGDADEFRLWLGDRVNGQGLGENTIRRRCGQARQFFMAAKRRKLITENPFGDMKQIAVGANRERDYFVSSKEAEKVLAACPNIEWRLLFALSRYGGLRCPSEHLALRWADIHWQQNRMTVRSPKTECYEGGESRVVPLFPELLPHLEAAFEAAEPGTEFVIAGCRDSNANLRTQLTRIIQRASLKPWPKLFHNLRASRQTELAQTYPIHVVCDWIGNGALIAAKHYLRTTETDFERAAQPMVGEGFGGEKSGAESGAAVVQKAVQQPAAVNCANGQDVESGLKFSVNSEDLPFKGSYRNTAQNARILPAGFEPALPD